MAAVKIFTGTTSTDGGLAGNYDDGVVPGNGDTIVFNDQSTKDWVYGTTVPTGKTVHCIVDRSFTKTIGTSGAPFSFDGLGTVLFMGNTINPCYFKAATATALARAIINTSSQKDDLVHLQGAIIQIDVLSGKAVIDGASPTISNAASRVKVMGSAGGSLAQLTIPSSVTLTNCEFYIEAGRLDCSSDMEIVQVSGGEFILNGGADITTRLEMNGGTTYWDASDTASPSTITLAEIMGGLLKTRTDRRGRTLTACNMYADGDVDFTIGGLNMTLPAIRTFGGNRPKFPLGTTCTIGT